MIRDISSLSYIALSLNPQDWDLGYYILEKRHDITQEGMGCKTVFFL